MSRLEHPAATSRSTSRSRSVRRGRDASVRDGCRTADRCARRESSFTTASVSFTSWAEPLDQASSYPARPMPRRSLPSSRSYLALTFGLAGRTQLLTHRLDHRQELDCYPGIIIVRGDLGQLLQRFHRTKLIACVDQHFDARCQHQDCARRIMLELGKFGDSDLCERFIPRLVDLME